MNDKKENKFCEGCMKISTCIAARMVIVGHCENKLMVHTEEEEAPALGINVHDAIGISQRTGGS